MGEFAKIRTRENFPLYSIFKAVTSEIRVNRKYYEKAQNR